RSAATVEAAAEAAINFERPAGWTRENPRGGHGWGRRLAYAQGLLPGGQEPAGPAPAWVDALPPEKRIALAGKAEAEAERRARLDGFERQAFGERLDDHLASVAATGEGLPGIT